MKLMYNSDTNVSTREFSLHLTIQSSDIIKTSLSTFSQLSISCDISEVPSVHCKLIISKKNQDIGAIGTIKFEKSRPIATANLNLSEINFDELRNLLCLSPPRPASLFLRTSKYNETSNGDLHIKNSGEVLDIFDISWRYPIL